jgi:hypothetical protein
MYDPWSLYNIQKQTKLNKARGTAIADKLTDLIDGELEHKRRSATLARLASALKDILEITATKEK